MFLLCSKWLSPIIMFALVLPPGIWLVKTYLKWRKVKCLIPCCLSATLIYETTTYPTICCSHCVFQVLRWIPGTCHWWQTTCVLRVSTNHLTGMQLSPTHPLSNRWALKPATSSLKRRPWWVRGVNIINCSIITRLWWWDDNGDIWKKNVNWIHSMFIFEICK